MPNIILAEFHELNTFTTINVPNYLKQRHVRILANKSTDKITSQN